LRSGGFVDRGSLSGQDGLPYSLPQQQPPQRVHDQPVQYGTMPPQDQQEQGQQFRQGYLPYVERGADPRSLEGDSRSGFVDRVFFSGQDGLPYSLPQQQPPQRVHDQPVQYDTMPPQDQQEQGQQLRQGYLPYIERRVDPRSLEVSSGLNSVDAQSNTDQPRVDSLLERDSLPEQDGLPYSLSQHQNIPQTNAPFSGAQAFLYSGPPGPPADLLEQFYRFENDPDSAINVAQWIGGQTVNLPDWGLESKDMDYFRGLGRDSCFMLFAKQAYKNEGRRAMTTIRKLAPPSLSAPIMPVDIESICIQWTPVVGDDNAITAISNRLQETQVILDVQRFFAIVDTQALVDKTATIDVSVYTNGIWVTLTKLNKDAFLATTAFAQRMQYDQIHVPYASDNVQRGGADFNFDSQDPTDSGGQATNVGIPVFRQVKGDGGTPIGLVSGDQDANFPPGPPHTLIDTFLKTTQENIEGWLDAAKGEIVLAEWGVKSTESGFIVDGLQSESLFLLCAKQAYRSATLFGGKDKVLTTLANIAIYAYQSTTQPPVEMDRLCQFWMPVVGNDLRVVQEKRKDLIGEVFAIVQTSQLTRKKAIVKIFGKQKNSWDTQDFKIDTTDLDQTALLASIMKY
jgi:hypothetical protein